MKDPGLVAHFYTEPVMQGRLVLCPVCYAQGYREILGALNKNGFVVSRNNKGATRIWGDFLVICTRCGLPIVQVRQETLNDACIKNLIKEEV